MRFDKYEWIVNPSEIKIHTSADYHIDKLVDGNCKVNGLFVNPTMIRGKGKFFGPKGEELCMLLAHFLRLGKSSDLYIPQGQYYKAYFTNFVFYKSTKGNCFDYEFEFVEDCEGKKEYVRPKYIIVEPNMNAFDIANQYDVPIEKIVEQNQLSDVFDLQVGERLILNEN